MNLSAMHLFAVQLFVEAAMPVDSGSNFVLSALPTRRLLDPSSRITARSIHVASTSCQSQRNGWGYAVNQSNESSRRCRFHARGVGARGLRTARGRADRHIRIDQGRRTGRSRRPQDSGAWGGCEPAGAPQCNGTQSGCWGHNRIGGCDLESCPFHQRGARKRGDWRPGCTDCQRDGRSFTGWQRNDDGSSWHCIDGTGNA